LPKTSLYALENGISNASVCDAFDTLGEEGLIHKNGRKWVVGKKSMASTSVIPQKRKTVVFITGDISQWRWIVKEFRSTIEESFVEELDIFGMRLEECILREPKEAVDVLKKEKEISSIINELKDNYAGCFLRLNGSEGIDAFSFVEFLLSFGKPVIYYAMTSSAHVHLTGEKNPRWELLYQCSIHNEDHAATLIIDHLAANGHSKIAIPFFSRRDKSGEWQQKRILALKNAAGSNPSLPNIVVAAITEEDWVGRYYHWQEELFDDLLEKIIKHSNKNDSLSKVIRLRELWPSFKQIVDDLEISAIIAPNDNYATIRLAYVSPPH
jgi:hypothetical protein